MPIASSSAAERSDAQAALHDALSPWSPLGESGPAEPLLSFDLKKNGKKTAELVAQVEVASKAIAQQFLAAEGRRHPNEHPHLPEPERKLPPSVKRCVLL